jgi:ATP-dependent helicase/nuclease subunit A
MPEFSLTPAQEAAVKHRGGPLLISAGAGSGKTRVLVERLLDRVVNEGLDIDSFLVITYTRAAAAELRSRILEALYERLALHPDSRHLRRQTALVYRPR